MANSKATNKDNFCIKKSRRNSVIWLFNEFMLLLNVLLIYIVARAHGRTRAPRCVLANSVPFLKEYVNKLLHILLSAPSNYLGTFGVHHIF